MDTPKMTQTIEIWLPVPPLAFAIFLVALAAAVIVWIAKFAISFYTGA